MRKMALKSYDLNWMRSLPKVETHLHLDGSLRLATWWDLVQQYNVNNPYPSLEVARKEMRFRINSNLPDCLAKFPLTLSVMQKFESLERITYELCVDQYESGVAHVEIRYCPTLHLEDGLSRQDVVDAVASGIRKAQDSLGISASQIICVLRNPVFGLFDDPVKDAEELLTLAADNKDNLVVGLDLAGDELNYPPQLFTEIFLDAKDEGLKVTMHAGEGRTDYFLGSLRHVVHKIFPDRIGHGVAMVMDEGLMQDMKDRGIGVECCPTSNVHTGSVCDFAMHPVKKMLEAGLSVTVCADNSLFSRTTMLKELLKVQVLCNLDDAEIENLCSNSLKMRF